jgi:hypothetical protein
MGIREALNKRPYLALAGIPLVVGVVVMGVRSARNVEPGPITTGFYSADDGKTFFSDDAQRIPPFDHHGNQAVRAHIFRGPDGKTFVGYLEKVTPEASLLIRKMQLRKATDPPMPMNEMNTVLAGHQFKRPGDKDWIGGTDAAGSSKVKDITGNDGTPLIEVDGD